MMMIPARRNGNGLDIFDEVFTDPFFGEKENKIMKTDLKEKDGKYMLEIDVPGYDRIEVADDTRFIATMNYNYAGTRELNEALASRFVVIQMPPLAKEDLERLLKDQFPSLVTKYNKQFALLFNELQKKCENGELTEKALDLRGLIDAVSLIKKGIPIRDALDLGITNKIFDSYEKELIRDVIASRFPLKLHNTEVFE